MQEYSSTQANNLTAIVGVIVLILNQFNINIGSEELMAVIGGLLSVIGIANNWIKRYKRGDLTLGGFRK
jgi:hypothetical protein